MHVLSMGRCYQILPRARYSSAAATFFLAETCKPCRCTASVNNCRHPRCRPMMPTHLLGSGDGRGRSLALGRWPAARRGRVLVLWRRHRLGLGPGLPRRRTRALGPRRCGRPSRHELNVRLVRLQIARLVVAQLRQQEPGAALTAVSKNPWSVTTWVIQASVLVLGADAVQPRRQRGVPPAQLLPLLIGGGVGLLQRLVLAAVRLWTMERLMRW